MAPKIGRNQPCPCGSGHKYKRCCGGTPPFVGGNPVEVIAFHDDDDALLELSNRVPVLLRRGEIDEAQRLCEELKRRFPDAIDWRDRFAELYEAQGDAKRAAAHYRMAADFARGAEGFDAQAIDWFLAQADRLDRER